MWNDWLQVLALKMTIGNLIMSMIEENTPESLLVAKVMLTVHCQGDAGHCQGDTLIFVLRIRSNKLVLSIKWNAL